jgi:hypothetical protein
MSLPVKACFKCGETKPLSEYYAHPMMRDKHLNKCKVCTREDTRVNTEKLLRDAVWVEKELERQRIKQRPKNKIAVISPEKKKEYVRRHRNKYPEKAVARAAVGNAIRDGRLKRKPCEVCGSENSEGHHEDYSKPLNVIWYCPKHHAERHVEIRRIQRMIKNNPPHSPLE